MGARDMHEHNLRYRFGEKTALLLQKFIFATPFFIHF
jgi:hypothetical protein